MTDCTYADLASYAPPRVKIGQGARGRLFLPAYGWNLSIARYWGVLRLLHATVTDRHSGVTVRYGMVHRHPSLMNTWEGNSIGLADAAGQMV